jgi:hypothetical protein
MHREDMPQVWRRHDQRMMNASEATFERRVLSCHEEIELDRWGWAQGPVGELGIVPGPVRRVTQIHRQVAVSAGDSEEVVVLGAEDSAAVDAGGAICSMQLVFRAG